MSEETKVAVVTGAGSGIGRQVAIGLLGRGYHVFLAGRRAASLSESANLAGKYSGRAHVHPTDVTDPAAVDDLFRAVENETGRIDILFNNAGMFPRSAPIEAIGYDEWTSAVAVNLTGAFLAAQAAFRLMKSQSPQGGRIINNGSISAQVPRPNAVAYTATKHAITGLTKSLALDGRPYRIACSQIDIGNAETELIAKISEAARERGEKPEPTIDLRHVTDAVLYICDLPLEVNVLFMTVMATQMPFVGRG
jgi:NAD(P)-dependent dehydrogenase (short-subunit alcohol dehydrogenase family)